MLSLQISDSLPSNDPDLQDLQHLSQVVALALLRAGADPEQTDLALVLSDDAQLHELNLQYLGIDAPTDVLSFPSDEIDPDSGMRYLGDILVSLPRARAQAQAGGHPLSDELRLLAVHGVLHLLGHDHADEVDKAAMWALQAEILRESGSSLIAPVGE